MVFNLPDTFPAILTFMQTHGYWVVFILMFFEGPIVTLAAAFAASFGIFNIYYIAILSFFGSQLPDIVLYFVGRFLRKKTEENFVSFFGLKKGRVRWIEKNLKKHSIKTILLVKFLPFGAIPGLSLAGFVKMHFKKYWWVITITNLFVAIFITALGFYSGVAINTIAQYFKLSKYLLPLAIILIIGAYFLIKLIYKEIYRYIKK